MHNWFEFLLDIIILMIGIINFTVYFYVAVALIVFMSCIFNFNDKPRFPM